MAPTRENAPCWHLPQRRRLLGGFTVTQPPASQWKPTTKHIPHTTIPPGKRRACCFGGGHHRQTSHEGEKDK